MDEGGPPPPRDRLGFLLEDDDLVELDRQSASMLASTILPRQRKAWAEVAAVAAVAPSSDVNTVLNSLRKSGKLRSMVRGGIPPELRATVWPLLCGAETKRKAFNDAEYYSRLLQTVDANEASDRAARSAAEGARQAGDAPRQTWELLDCLEQIDKDLKRTFPKHRLIGTPEGQESLRRVLRAYCAGRNLRTGYCQGMNFLVGMLLCVMDDSGPGGGSADGGAVSVAGEEAAFWMLVMLIERLLPGDYYTDGLTGVRVDSEILLDLMASKLPALHAHLERCQVLLMMPMVTTQWFIALFVLWLPTEALLRLWDCFLVDGLKSKNKTFFRAALTLFKLHEKALMRIDDAQELMDVLRSMSKRTFDADAMLAVTYDRQWLGQFKSKTLHKREQVHRLAAEAEAARRAERQAARPQRASPAQSSASAGGGASEPALSARSEASATADMTELVVARMERMQSVFGAREELAAEDGELDEGDEGADDDDEEDEDDLMTPGAAAPVDVSDGAGGAAGGGSEDAFVAGWQPRGTLLKKSPAAGTSLIKKLGWQRRWFEIAEGEFRWYASAKAVAKGQEPLGRVPLRMILTATPNASGGAGFTVDLGNRVLDLQLDGVPKAHHATGVRLWIEALVKQEVISHAGDGKDSHHGKFWKSPKEKKSAK